MKPGSGAIAENQREPRESLSRRDLLHVGTGTAAIAAATAIPAQVLAQNAPPAAPAARRTIRTGEQNPFYDYSPMLKRKKISWPNGARVAVHIVPNIEHWDVHDDKGHLDVRNNPRNDYGLRVAAWRLFDVFSERRIPTTIALNATVCKFYPGSRAAATSWMPTRWPRQPRQAEAEKPCRRLPLAVLGAMG